MLNVLYHSLFALILITGLTLRDNLENVYVWKTYIPENKDLSANVVEKHSALSELKPFNHSHFKVKDLPVVFLENFYKNHETELVQIKKHLGSKRTEI